jgi:hypothetical protein
MVSLNKILLVSLVAAYINTAQASGLYLSPAPLQEKPLNLPMINKEIEPIVALRSRTSCISGDLYYEIITPAGEHALRQVTNIYGEVTKCRQK